MKLSKSTLEILKNYSKISKTIIFREGNFLVTRSADESVVSYVTLEDSFPQSCCIFDLNEFLAIISMYNEDVELTFHDTFVDIVSGSNKLTYYLANKRIYDSVSSNIPKNKVNLGQEPSLAFDLKATDLQNIIKTAALLNLESLEFSNKGVEVKVPESKGTGFNHLFIKLPVEGETSQKASISVQNLFMVKGDYRVEVYIDKKVARFIAQDGSDLEYFVMFKTDV